MGYFSRRRTTRKKHKLEHDGQSDIEEENKVNKQDEKHKGNGTYKSEADIHIISDEVKCKSENLEEELTRLNCLVSNNSGVTESKKCVIAVEVYKENITGELEKHDWLDEPEKTGMCTMDNDLNHEVNPKKTMSISVQTDVHMADIELIESKVKELSQSITKEHQKLSSEWKKITESSRDDILNDEDIVNNEFEEIENIKYKLVELEIKLKLLFDKNLDKTITLLDKVTQLYNEIKKQENWGQYLNNEINTKREEIKEAKLELREERESHKSLQREMIAKRDEIREARNKLSAFEEKWKTQEMSITKQAEALNAVMAEVESLKSQQIERFRKEVELDTVTRHRDGTEHPYSTQLSQIGRDGEATISSMPNKMTKEFDIGDREREFDDLMQFPVQESQEMEQTEVMKYVMDDDNFDGRYEFYERQFEVLGLFSNED